MCVIYNIGKVLEQIIEEVKMKKVTSIYTKILDKKKILVSNEIKAEEFVAADFCSDLEAKKLVTVT